jgi:hypothetical protein
MATVAGIQPYFSFFLTICRLSGRQRTFTIDHQPFLFYFPKYLLMISQHKEPQLIPAEEIGLEVSSRINIQQDAYYWLVIQQL